MAFEGQQPLKLIGAVTGADLSATSAQYKLVKFTNTTSGRQSLCSATTDIPSGVLQAEAPTSATDQPIEVVSVGQTKCKDDGTTQAGQICGTNASGLMTPALSTMYPIARCIVPSGVSGGIGTYVVNAVAPTVKA